MALLAALRSVGDETAERVPPGWFTSDELAAEEKLSRDHIVRRFRPLIKSGVIERRKFRIKMSNGVVRPVEHYRYVNRSA